MENIILTDADGVLLNWADTFQEWMRDRGYHLLNPNTYSVAEQYGLTDKVKKILVKQFNDSSTIGFLPPHKDALRYVRKMHEEMGYVFRVITSVSLDPYSMRLREQNLRDLFGTAIEHVICLDTGADKDDQLDMYQGRDMMWVEDKPENAEIGYKFGLTSIIMGHDHNAGYEGECVRVNGWKDIYDTLIG
jgi:hypothetical protein|tara:strand:- start:4609 stop:5178 length:570 start_codon:yes stop_codon:yes gene_type:complete